MEPISTPAIPGSVSAKPGPPEPRKAAPLIPPVSEMGDANIKEALGRFVCLSVYANDPMATLSPLIYLVVPMLKRKGAGDRYTKQIEGWKDRRNTAIHTWNVTNGKWKDAKIIAEDVITEILEVCMVENLIIMNQAMMDITDMVARPMPGASGGGGP